MHISKTTQDSLAVNFSSKWCSSWPRRKNSWPIKPLPKTPLVTKHQISAPLFCYCNNIFLHLKFDFLTFFACCSFILVAIHVCLLKFHDLIYASHIEDSWKKDKWLQDCQQSYLKFHYSFSLTKQRSQMLLLEGANAIVLLATVIPVWQSYLLRLSRDIPPPPPHLLACNPHDEYTPKADDPRELLPAGALAPSEEAREKCSAKREERPPSSPPVPPPMSWPRCQQTGKVSTSLFPRSHCLWALVALRRPRESCCSFFLASLGLVDVYSFIFLSEKWYV